MVMPAAVTQAAHSGWVGIRKPVGHGLLVPETPCQRLSFRGLRQSYGELGAKMNLVVSGDATASVGLRVEEVEDVVI